MPPVRCFHRVGFPDQCQSRSTEMRHGRAYCAEHAAQLDRNQPQGRMLRSNPHRLTEEEGGLDTAIRETLARLEAAAIASFGDGAARPRGLAASDPSGWVADRMATRYRRKAPQNDLPSRWEAVGLEETGRPASTIIESALRGLAGIDEGNEFLIPSSHVPAVPLRDHLEAVEQSLKELLRDEVAARQLVALADADAEAKAVRVRVSQLQTALPALIAQLDATKVQHRPPKTAADAAAVLLAGCWWLAIGRWPSVANEGKGRFYDWGYASLRRLRPDLADPSQQALAGLARAIKRQKKIVPPDGDAVDIPGPWLAWRILTERGKN
jgi:hypothetical protein